MKKLMIMAAMLSFAAACGGNTQNEKSEEVVETVETEAVVEESQTEMVTVAEETVETDEQSL